MNPPESSAQWLRVVRIFVSSPGDMRSEREAVLRVIERLNRLYHIRQRYVLIAQLYEAVPPQAGDAAQAIVDRSLSVRDSYVLVCVLGGRLGTPFVHPETGEAHESGTVYEFTTAYEAHERFGSPHVLLYRKLDPAPDPDPEQRRKVDAFFGRFEGEAAPLRGLYGTFREVPAFEAMLFEHLDRLLGEHPPPLEGADRVDAATRPEILEEPRRLDAAIPGMVHAGRPTELWVQVCLPESEGFRDRLPAVTGSADLLGREDVRENGLTVAFPIDPASGRPTTVAGRVEISGPDFEVPEPVQEIEFTPGRDSAFLVFGLTPRRAARRSIVRVAVRVQTPHDGRWVVLGTVPLSTRVPRPGIAAARRVAWALLSIPLAAAAPGPEARAVLGGPERLDRDKVIRSAPPSHGQVERAVEKSRTLVERGNFAAARRLIRELPDAPGMEELKRRLLGQIDEAERAFRAALEEGARLMKRLAARNISPEQISQIAKDNNIDPSNRMAFVALLRAIDRQT